MLLIDERNKKKASNEIEKIQYDEKMDIKKNRHYIVSKSNQIIQNARYNLSLQEQKVLAYIISLVKPGDKKGKTYEFDVAAYCKTVGIERSGNIYKQLKDTLKGLRDKSIWVRQENGTERTVGWLSKVSTTENPNVLEIVYDEDMSEFLLELNENFTKYELIYFINMESMYSTRLYELLKSYSWTKLHLFEVEDLKKQLNAEKYKTFGDFKRNVLDKAIKEINVFTDIEISYKFIKKGNKIIQIEFEIKEKGAIEAYKASKIAENRIDGQLSIEDFNIFEC